MLSFTLPLGPSVNNMYEVTQRGVHLSERARQFKHNAGLIVRNAAQLQGWEYVAGQRLELTIGVWFPNRKRADLSNLIKVTEDAIAEALGFDDQYIDSISISRRGVDKTNARCEIALGVVSPGAGA